MAALLGLLNPYAFRRTEALYHISMVIGVIGASLKDLGRKCFAFMKLDPGEIPRIKKTAFAGP